MRTNYSSKTTRAISRDQRREHKFCVTTCLIFLGDFGLRYVHFFWANLVAFNLLFGPAMNKLKVQLTMAT